MSVKEVENINSTKANATRGKVYTRHKYTLHKQQGNRKIILEKAKPRMFHFKNIHQTEDVHIKRQDKAGNIQ